MSTLRMGDGGAIDKKGLECLKKKKDWSTLKHTRRDIYVALTSRRPKHLDVKFKNVTVMSS